jgi:hypothetical protein
VEADPGCSIACESLHLATLTCGSSLAASTAQDFEEMKAANNTLRSLGTRQPK